MNYIEQLQAEKAEAIDSACTIETEINASISYLCADQFRIDTRVQVGDVPRVLLPLKNDVTYLAATLSRTKFYSKNK
jgi:hypothetical protein